MSTRGEQIAAAASYATETMAIQVIEQTRKDQREFKGSLLGELMDCSQEKKIARIKIVRTHTGLDLRHAKMVMDALNDEIPFIDMAEAGRDHETLQRLGDENSRLRSQCGESEDKLGKSQSQLRLAISTRDAISDRYGSTQDLVEDARSILRVIANRVSVCPTVSHLVLGATALLDDACDE